MIVSDRELLQTVFFLLLLLFFIGYAWTLVCIAEGRIIMPKSWTGRARRVDNNHKAIIDFAVNVLGRTVFDTHALPGRLDFDILSAGGLTFAVEVKQPGEKLTEKEEAYFSAGWPAFVVHSEQELFDHLQVIDKLEVK